MQNRLLKTALTVGIPLLTASFGFGQAVAPAPSSTVTVRNGEEVVELTPFTVDAEKDVGYVATSSLMGSRMNTSLKDTASSISVLTAEFLADVAASNFSEALQWANNVQIDVGETVGVGDDNEPVLSYAKFRVRGIPATVTRNYFPWTLSTDTFNMDRIEEQRGPNSILFGIGAPGGVINASTKQGFLTRNFRKLGLQTGSYDSYRGTLDVNQAAWNKRLAFRFNAVHQRNRSWRQHVQDKTSRGHLTGTLKLTSTTSLRAEYETGDIDMNAARGTSPWDGFTSWAAAGMPTVVSATGQNLGALGLVSLGTAQRVTYLSNSNSVYNMANQLTSNGIGNRPLPESLSDRSINVGGPGQKRLGHYNATSIFLDQRIGERTFVQLAYNHQDDANQSYMAGIGRSENNRLKADPMQFLPNGAPNPNVGRYFLEGDRWAKISKENRSDNSRLQLSRDQDFGKWGNYRVAGMGEFRWTNYRQISEYESWAGSAFNSNPEGANNVVWRRTYVEEGEWGTYYISSPLINGLIKDMPNPIPGAGRPATISSAWVKTAAPTENVDYLKTMLVGGQARYFKNRLVLGLGYRRDSLKRVLRGGVRDPQTLEFTTDYSAAATEARYARANTKTLGAVAHLTKNISAFFNYSNSFDLPNNQRVLPNSKTAGNSESEGKDFGLAFTLLDDRINLRVNRYTTDVKGGVQFLFTSTADNPSVINANLLRILVDNGFLTQAQADARRIDTSGTFFDRHM
ncbi:MAG: TonB-dependent receptor plug domain-containing protein, partial [Verrucomicrobiota bacterium]